VILNYGVWLSGQIHLQIKLSESMKDLKKSRHISGAKAILNNEDSSQKNDQKSFIKVMQNPKKPKFEINQKEFWMIMMFVQ
jgi:hypothetical protein